MPVPSQRRVIPLPIEFVQLLVNYLSERPYKEVKEAIHVLVSTPSTVIVSPEQQPAEALAKDPAPVEEAPAKG